MSALPWIRNGSVRDAIRARYAESAAERYGVEVDAFENHVMAVVERYAHGAAASEQIALVKSLHVEELILARACSAGNDAAWDVFLARYRGELYRTACRMARDEGQGRELADGLYADLYGIPNREGRRVSKLDYYMGRGSLAGWLRTVLAQTNVNRYRRGARDVSLEEQMEQGVAFASAAPPDETADAEAASAAVAGALAACMPEERFLLAAYFLDGCTLAQIGRQTGVHESTISRKLDRLAATLRKRVRKRLLNTGMSRSRCDELLAEIDVRDLNVNVAATFRQESEIETFQKETEV